MSDSHFTRFRSADDANDCAALGEDPEWNELIAWAGVKTGGPQSGTSESDDGSAGEGDSTDEADVSSSGSADGADSEDWDAVIALAKTPEDWDAVIALAKAAAIGPPPIDELSSMRARQAQTAHIAAPAPQRQAPAPDAWDIALVRAKRA